MLNLAQLRADTPGVDHRLHLNNAGASLMPRSVLDVMQEYLKRESEIGGYETADEREDVIAASYDEIAELIGTKPDNVAVVANATAGFVQAMSSFDFVAGDTITAYSKRVPADRVVKELTRRGINTVLTLREYGILDFDAKGVSAAIRVSPHCYNTDSEIETFLGAIEEILTTA